MKQKMKRYLAMFLSAAMAVSAFPSSVVNADDGDQPIPLAESQDGLIAKFDFNDAAVDKVFTSTGGDAIATIAGSGTVSLQERDAENGKALYLDGSAAWLSLTTKDKKSLFTGKEEITISFDAKPDRSGTNWGFYAAPDAEKQNGREQYIGALINGGNTKIERYLNGRADCPSSATGTGWSHVDVIFTETDTLLYVGGDLKGKEVSKFKLTDILGEKSIFQIGKANWGDGEYYKGWIDNFVIQEDVPDELIPAANILFEKELQADVSALKLPEQVEKDFALPMAGDNGSVVAWSVDKNPYIAVSEDGSTAIVTPSWEEEGTVDLTAGIVRNTFFGRKLQETKNFTVKVKKIADPLTAAKEQLDQITIPNSANIRGNITLPTEIILESHKKTVPVTWTAEPAGIISVAEKDGKPAGVVTRPAQDTNVTLTAAITLDDSGNTQSYIKKFPVTVKAAYEMPETTDYLFAFFVNNGGASEQQIFMASSHDGNNWMDLNKKEAVLSVADSVRDEEDLQKNQNQAGVRDPYILRSPEGDRFWIIATDLCIGDNNIAAGTVDWGVSQYSGSHCLRIWESDDLVHWSEPWLADVAPEDTTCAWAPEAVYDDTTGEYIVFFAAMTTMENGNKVQKVYYAKTRDFRTFTKPVKMIDNGKDHIIDTTIVKAEDGKYYRGSAAGGSIFLEKCKAGADWKGLDSWETQGSIKEITPFTAGLEGPELFKYNEDDYKEVNGEKVATYGLLADNFGGVGYVPFYTTDIANAKWIKVDDNDFNFDTLHKRHGGILNLTAEEYDRIMEAYGPASIAVKTAPAKLTYNAEDDVFVPDRLVLTVTYANGKTEDVTYSSSGKNGRQFVFKAKTDAVAAGEQELTVTYGEKRASFRSTVEMDPWDTVPKDDRILAEFDFDEEESIDGKQGFTSENANAVGSFQLKDSYNGDAGKALYLDGSSTNFLTVTDKNGGSLLAGADELTISYEFKPDRTGTNWVLYAAPNANEPKDGSERYLGILVNNGETKVERYNNSGSRPTNPAVQTGSEWSRVDIVITRQKTTVYLNGVKRQTADSSYKLRGILGMDSILQIGKANWGGGEYAKGWIDNLRIRNRASTADEIAELAADFANTLPRLTGVTVGEAPDRDTALTYRGTDGNPRTAVWSVADEKTKTITSYVKWGTSLTEVPVAFEFNGSVTIKTDGNVVENGSKMDLSRDRTVTLSRLRDSDENWTIKTPILCNNPVLPGQYADPDIDYFNGKFWIYPTTDGYSGWSGTKFHAFSSKDMVTWEDEGIILELANNNPGVNEKGIQIAASPWAAGGSAWAPTIEEKNGKYYFYYCGKFSSGESAVGVAVADDPAGPYTDKGEALITESMCSNAGAGVGQAIDPSIFTDDDGKSYILLGNGSAVIAELNDDMMSIKEETIKRINGLTDFRESVIVTKANGIYHWTWSCDDANSPNYHVNYGTSEKLLQDDGTVNVTLKKKNLLSKDESKGILGSAHQSVLHVQDVSGKDRYFMAYHRFYTPVGIFKSSDGLGVHRETCIDEITFDEKGEMVITPTLEGVGPVTMEEKPPVEVMSVSLDQNKITLKPGETITLRATVEPADAANQSLTWASGDAAVAEVKDGVVTAKAAGTTVITVTSANGKSASCTVTVASDSSETSVKVTSVNLNKTKITLGLREKFTLSATVQPKNATDKSLKFKSNNTKIATVTPNGVVTAKKIGKTTITVTAGGNTVKCQITVKAAPKKITLNAKEKTLRKNKTFQIKVKLPKKTASNKITYKTSNKKVATVSASGKVKAVGKGKAAITVKAFNGKKAKLSITVK